MFIVLILLNFPGRHCYQHLGYILTAPHASNYWLNRNPGSNSSTHQFCSCSHAAEHGWKQTHNSRLPHSHCLFRPSIAFTKFFPVGHFCLCCSLVLGSPPLLFIWFTAPHSVALSSNITSYKVIYIFYFILIYFHFTESSNNILFFYFTKK